MIPKVRTEYCAGVPVPNKSSPAGSLPWIMCTSTQLQYGILIKSVTDFALHFNDEKAIIFGIAQSLVLITNYIHLAYTTS